MGCHVAPCGWVSGCVKLWGLHRSQTPDLFQATDWQDRENRLPHWCDLIVIWKNLYLSLVKCLFGGGNGWGLAPARGLFTRPYHRTKRQSAGGVTIGISPWILSGSHRTRGHPPKKGAGKLLSHQSYPYARRLGVSRTGG
jgi:hypothetical protein